MKPHGYWTPARLQEDADKHATRGGFQKDSPAAYVTARKMGILNDICKHMPPPKTEAYSLEELQLEADKHTSRQRLAKANNSLYVVAWKRGVLDQICKHMDPPLTAAYTLEEIREGANKCTEYGEFKKIFPHLYSAASKRRVLPLVCSHMKHSKTTSSQEIELFKIVKSFYKNAKKLIDRKVKIKGKPYIQGFHIDIYVPDLKRGIEFDGEYYHSFEFVRKSKSKKLWTDSDIRNYDKIKDTWFASKGIEILHIKEKDWTLDKAMCIKRCLKFLRGRT